MPKLTNRLKAEDFYKNDYPDEEESSYDSQSSGGKWSFSLYQHIIDLIADMFHDPPDDDDDF